MIDVDTHPEARAELIEALDWYDADRPGSALRLSDAYDEVVRRILHNPLAYAVDDDYGTRYALLGKHSYVVHFVIRRDKSIKIIAVAHTSRESGYWSHRLRR